MQCPLVVAGASQCLATPPASLHRLPPYLRHGMHEHGDAKATAALLRRRLGAAPIATAATAAASLYYHTTTHHDPRHALPKLYPTALTLSVPWSPSSGGPGEASASSPAGGDEDSLGQWWSILEGLGMSDRQTVACLAAHPVGWWRRCEGHSALEAAIKLQWLRHELAPSDYTAILRSSGVARGGAVSARAGGGVARGGAAATGAPRPRPLPEATVLRLLAARPVLLLAPLWRLKRERHLVQDLAAAWAAESSGGSGARNVGAAVNPGSSGSSSSTGGSSSAGSTATAAAGPQASGHDGCDEDVQLWAYMLQDVLLAPPSAVESAPGFLDALESCRQRFRSYRLPEDVVQAVVTAGDVEMLGAWEMYLVGVLHVPPQHVRTCLLQSCRDGWWRRTTPEAMAEAPLKLRWLASLLAAGDAAGSEPVVPELQAAGSGTRWAVDAAMALLVAAHPALLLTPLASMREAAAWAEGVARQEQQQQRRRQGVVLHEQDGDARDAAGATDTLPVTRPGTLTARTSAASTDGGHATATAHVPWRSQGYGALLALPVREALQPGLERAAAQLRQSGRCDASGSNQDHQGSEGDTELVAVGALGLLVRHLCDGTW